MTKMFSKNSIIFQERMLNKYFLYRNVVMAKKEPIYSKLISDEYQYLHKSKLPTLHFQNVLFRLPIPELDKTCNRYLNALKPLLKAEQWEKTKALVQEFQKGIGKELHAALKAKDSINKHTSYISQPWFDMYLKDRSPLPLNFNPAIVFNQSHHKNIESQLCKATNMTISSMRFMKSLRNNFLKPEVFHFNPKKSDTELFNTCLGLLPPRLALYAAYAMKAFPLDMSQHPNLFGSTRIPCVNKDKIVSDQLSKHILVIKNGHFFKVDVLDDFGDILPPEELYTVFKYIIDQNLTPNKNSIGVLTTENRDIWAKAREHLMSISSTNSKNIKTIDSALFVVCLDEDSVQGDIDKIMRTFLHGKGYNRWFDKSFSLIITKDALAAVNFEHSWGDGVAVLRYIKDVFNDVNNHPFVDIDTQVINISPEQYVEELNFTVDAQLSDYLKKATEKFDKLCGSLGLDVVQHQGLGRKSCLPADIAPDALMQLSFQVAHHKVYGSFVSTYESCSTSGFRHGRTEAIRPCTEATKTFALKFNSSNRPGKGELAALAKESSEKHKTLTKEALMGEGFDRHLFALKNISEELGQDLPELYKDEAYQLLNYNVLSTSTLAADAIMVGGFGPVVPDGLGVGYAIRSQDCGAIITSYSSAKNGTDFADALKITLSELEAIIKN